MPRGPNKPKRDPNRPKRNMSAFMFYSQFRRPQLKAEDADRPFGEYAKIIGEEWRSMGDNQKKPYEKQAAKDKKRYVKAMASYVPPPVQKGRKKRAKKDPNAPKRACSAYMFYMQERRPQLVKRHPDWPFGQFGKVIGEEWREMSDNKKTKFEKLSQKDRARYEKEMARWNAKK